MNISFSKYEYDDGYKIVDIRYTNYSGYGDKTEVIIGRNNDVPYFKKYVLDGWLDIPIIIKCLLQQDLTMDFEEEN